MNGNGRNNNNSKVKQLQECYGRDQILQYDPTNFALFAISLYIAIAISADILNIN